MGEKRKDGTCLRFHRMPALPRVHRAQVSVPGTGDGGVLSQVA